MPNKSPINQNYTELDYTEDSVLCNEANIPIFIFCFNHFSFMVISAIIRIGPNFESFEVGYLFFKEIFIAMENKIY